MAHGRVQNHRGLEVWKLSIELTVRLYECTDQFPGRERFGLSAQMRRAAVSIASNIAEGAGRGSRLEFARFLHFARGSVAELDTQMTIASRLGYMSYGGDLPKDLVRLNIMLTHLIRRLTAD